MYRFPKNVPPAYGRAGMKPKIFDYFAYAEVLGTSSATKRLSEGLAPKKPLTKIYSNEINNQQKELF
jgi:hypothetical protein